MKKILLIAFILQAFCATAWAQDLKWDKYYVYCTAGGRPDVGSGSDVGRYLKNHGSSPSVYLISQGFSNRSEADNYLRSLKGSCPKN